MLETISTPTTLEPPPGSVLDLQLLEAGRFEHPDCVSYVSGCVSYQSNVC